MNSKVLKKIMSMALALMMIMSVGTVNAFASSTYSSDTPKIKSVDYEGKGKVDVEFDSKVKYRNVKVTVKDIFGESYKTKITDKDKDELEFRVLKYSAGKEYSFTISGIKKSRGSEYTSVSGSFEIPEATSAPKIDDIDYKGKGKVDVEFDGKVKYRNVKVAVKDNSGKRYTAKIIEKDSDEIEFKILGYKTGRTYNFTISGVKKPSADSYVSVSGSLKIPAPKYMEVKKVEYDADDWEVSFEFAGKVSWDDVDVSITDEDGEEYVVEVISTDDDELEVSTEELIEGDSYSYEISGVKAEDADSFGTIEGMFTAYDD